jgi:phosphatidylethanolamine-binding protein (PEBP) family uncharacterized protein
MFKLTHALCGALLLLTVSLTACGSTSPSTAAKPIAKIQLTSSAIKQAKIPARYTCDGANTSPPLEWGPVPAGITELVLFLVRVQPGQGTLSVEWALAGLKPTLHKVAAGVLPSGAYLEPASEGRLGYSVCPATGQTAEYQFRVYALPAGVTAGNEITGPALLNNLTSATPQDRAPAEGGFTASYTRK